jgi:DNA polymerase V
MPYFHYLCSKQNNTLYDETDQRRIQREAGAVLRTVYQGGLPVDSIVGVFVSSNPFREDLLQYWKYDELRLITPTSSTIPIVQAAAEVLNQIFIQGVQYKRAGVIVMGISPNSPIQQDLFDVTAEQIGKMKRLDEVIDRINKCYGSETIVIGAQQYTQKNGKGKAEVFANAIKHDFKSKNPTTRWSDIIRLK